MKKTILSLAAFFTLLATAFPLHAGDALDLAIFRHDVSAIGKALDEGADIEARQKITGCTPLMEAVRAKCAPKERLEMVKLLLDRGAKIEAKGERGDTVLYYAITAIVFDDPSDHLSRHCLPGQEEVIRLLLERGANPNAPVGNSGTVFGNAVSLLNRCPAKCPVDHLEIIKMMLKKGAKPSSDNLEAVLRRSESNVDEVVEMMLEKGANSNPKKEGITGGSSSVADAVVYNSNPNATKLLKILLKKGLDPNAADGMGRPIHLFLAEGMEKEDASKCKYFEKLLLVLGAGGNPLKLSGFVAQVSSPQISSYTSALITGKNRDLPQFLATATPQERAELLTAVEKHQAKMKVQAGRFNEEGRNAIQGGKKENAKVFRERALEVNAYLDVLKEIRGILEES